MRMHERNGLVAKEEFVSWKETNLEREKKQIQAKEKKQKQKEKEIQL